MILSTTNAMAGLNLHTLLMPKPLQASLVSRQQASATALRFGDDTFSRAVYEPKGAVPLETLASAFKPEDMKKWVFKKEADKLVVHKHTPEGLKPVGEMTQGKHLPKSFRFVVPKGGETLYGTFESDTHQGTHYFLLPGSKVKFSHGASVSLLESPQASSTYRLEGVARQKVGHTEGILATKEAHTASAKPLDANVFLLAGGFSSRFYPFTDRISSKTAAPLQPGLTIPGTVMAQLYQQGARNFITAVHYKPEETLKGLHASMKTFQEAQHKLAPEEASSQALHAFYLHETQAIGTAGSLLGLMQPKHRVHYPLSSLDTHASTPEVQASREVLQKTLQARPMIVVQGDAVIKDIDFQAVLKAHQQAKKDHGALATIVALQTDDASILPNFGCIKSSHPNESGLIQQFIEKPKDVSVLNHEDPTKPPHRLVNTGIYVLEPEVFQRVSDHLHQAQAKQDAPVDFGHDVFPLLIKQGVPLYTHVAEGTWSDVGNLSAYHHTLKHHHAYLDTLPKSNPFKHIGSLMVHLEKPVSDGTKTHPASVPSIAVTPEARKAFEAERHSLELQGNVLVAKA
ncbi:MAG: NDP-sugar synthase [Vampirovibrionales bacterium]